MVYLTTTKKNSTWKTKTLEVKNEIKRDLKV